MSAIERLQETLNNARFYTPAELGQQIMNYVDAKEAAADLARLRAIEAAVVAAVGFSYRADGEVRVRTDEFEALIAALQEPK